MVPPLGSHGNKASFTILSNNACCSCNIDEAKIHLNLPKRCYPSRCTFHDSGSALEFYLTPRHNITSAVSANWWSFQVRTQHKYVSSQSQWSEDGIYRKQSRWFFRDQQPDIESGLPTGLHTGFIAVVTTCVFSMGNQVGPLHLREVVATLLVPLPPLLAPIHRKNGILRKGEESWNI